MVEDERTVKDITVGELREVVLKTIETAPKPECAKFFSEQFKQHTQELMEHLTGRDIEKIEDRTKIRQFFYEMSEYISSRRNMKKVIFVTIVTEASKAGFILITGLFLAKQFLLKKVGGP